MKVIEINEFMRFLQKNDLVIVSAAEFQANKQIELNALRAKLLKKKAICISDIVKAELLPYSTTQGVRHWLDRQLTKNVHYYQESSGKRRIMVLTEVLKKYLT